MSDQEAILLGLGRGMGETVRIVTHDGKALLAYSGYCVADAVMPGCLAFGEGFLMPAKHKYLRNFA